MLSKKGEKISGGKSGGIGMIPCRRKRSMEIGNTLGRYYRINRGWAEGYFGRGERERQIESAPSVIRSERKGT